jgi:hypothetical protein
MSIVSQSRSSKKKDDREGVFGLVIAQSRTGLAPLNRMTSGFVAGHDRKKKREELNAVFGKPNITKVPTPMPGLVALQASQNMEALYFLDYCEKKKGTSRTVQTSSDGLKKGERNADRGWGFTWSPGGEVPPPRRVPGCQTCGVRIWPQVHLEGKCQVGALRALRRC